VGTIKLVIDADDARAFQMWRREQAQAKKLEENLAKVGRTGERAGRKVERGMKGAGRSTQQLAGFAKRAVTGLTGVAGVIGLVRQGLQEWVRYHKEAGQTLQPLLDGYKRLASIAASPKDMKQFNALIPGMIRASAMRPEEAQQFLFSAKSALEDQFGASLPALQKLAPLLPTGAEAAGFTFLNKTAAFRKLNATQRLRLLVEGAGLSEVDPGEYAQPAAKSASIAKRLGLSLPETLAGLNTVIKGAPNRNVAGTMYMRLLSNAAESMEKLAPAEQERVRGQFAAGGIGALVQWVGRQKPGERAGGAVGSPLASDLRDTRAKRAFQNLQDRMDMYRRQSGILATAADRPVMVERRAALMADPAAKAEFDRRVEVGLLAWEKSQSATGIRSAGRARGRAAQERQMLRDESYVRAAGRRVGAWGAELAPWGTQPGVEQAGETGAAALEWATGEAAAVHRALPGPIGGIFRGLERAAQMLQRAGERQNAPEMRPRNED